MKYTGPKVRISRRLGVPLTPKAAKVMGRRPYPPGQHGPAKQFRRSRPSPYSEQLIEKQKLREQYNVHERQLRRYYEIAASAPGNTPDIFISLLETRFDALVYRAGLATTIYQARQLVNHGHFLINGKRMNIPSYQCKVGETMQVRPKSHRLLVFEQALSGRARRPDYLMFTESTLTFSLTRIPKYEDISVFAEVPKVVEYYAR